MPFGTRCAILLSFQAKVQRKFQRELPVLARPVMQVEFAVQAQLAVELQEQAWLAAPAVE